MSVKYKEFTSYGNSIFITKIDSSKRAVGFAARSMHRGPAFSILIYTFKNTSSFWTVSELCSLDRGELAVNSYLTNIEPIFHLNIELYTMLVKNIDIVHYAEDRYNPQRNGKALFIEELDFQHYILKNMEKLDMTDIEADFRL